MKTKFVRQVFNLSDKFLIPIIYLYYSEDKYEVSRLGLTITTYSNNCIDSPCPIFPLKGGVMRTRWLGLYMQRVHRGKEFKNYESESLYRNSHKALLPPSSWERERNISNPNYFLREEKWQSLYSGIQILGSGVDIFTYPLNGSRWLHYKE